MAHWRQRNTRAIIILDGRTFDIVHVYVNCSLQDAMRQFLQQVKGNIDLSYSDTRDELEDMLDRYQFVETSHVTIRR